MSFIGNTAIQLDFKRSRIDVYQGATKGVLQGDATSYSVLVACARTLHQRMLTSTGCLPNYRIMNSQATHVQTISWKNNSVSMHRLTMKQSTTPHMYHLAWHLYRTLKIFGSANYNNNRTEKLNEVTHRKSSSTLAYVRRICACNMCAV